MQGVGGQLRRMPLCRRQPTDCLIDGVYIDQSRIENRRAIDHFGDCRRGGASGPASLGVEGDRLDPAVIDQERDARQVPAGSPTRSAREGPVGSRPNPALIPQKVLEKLALHAFRVKRAFAWFSPRLVRAITHTYLPGGCG